MRQYSPKNILVTGGAGFIGSNFIRFLLNSDKQVNIVDLDCLSYAGSLANLQALPDAERHNFVQGDICDRQLIDKLLHQYHIDTIVHFAAESHVDRSITGPAAFVQTNIIGTFTLLEASRQYWLNEKKWSAQDCRFHHISTDEVYGTLSATDSSFTENTPYAPNSPYSASKAGSDHLVRAYQHTYNLPTTMTNCSNNYGPYQHDEKLIPTIIRCCLNWEPIPIYGNGKNIRDWLYVEDHCSGIAAVLKQSKVGESYNIGGDQECDNLQVVQTICSLMDGILPREKNYNTLINFVADRPGHDWRYAVNFQKIEQQLGWRPQADFQNGLLKTIQWYIQFYNNTQATDAKVSA